VDFHGERRTNETHVAPHEPQAKLFRKGKGQLAKLYYMGHVLMEQSPGSAHRDAEFTEANGFAERAAGIRLMKRQAARAGRTLAAEMIARAAYLRAQARGFARVTNSRTGSAQRRSSIARWRCVNPRQLNNAVVESSR